jgi:hypothetical protein
MLGVLLLAFLLLPLFFAEAQSIGKERYLITPVSRDVRDPALKVFAAYAKKKWNLEGKTGAIPNRTPVAYGQILEWKGKAQADIFWGGEGTIFDALSAEGLLESVNVLKKMGDEIPAGPAKPVGFPLKDPKGFWAATTLEPYSLIYQPKVLRVTIKDWITSSNPSSRGKSPSARPAAPAPAMPAMRSCFRHRAGRRAGNG